MSVKDSWRDEYNNLLARPGFDVCECGATTWVNDRCTECGMVIDDVWHAQLLRGEKVKYRPNVGKGK